MAGMLTLAALADDPARFHLIDVCEAQDCLAAQVAGAVNISLGEFERRFGQIQAGGTPAAVRAGATGRSVEGFG